MPINNSWYTSTSQDWATPAKLKAELYDEFNLNYDPCPLNPEVDGLKVEWHGRAFVNPPYKYIKEWLRKALLELDLGNIEIAVFLVPSRTDTKWFHELAYANATETRFIKGRLKYGDGKQSAPFPSVIFIFR